MHVPARRAERHGQEPERPSRLAFVATLALLVLIGGVAIAGFGYYSWCMGKGGLQTPVSVTVPEGATGQEVVELLHEADVIRCGGLVEKFIVSGKEKANEVLAGEHVLTTNMTLDEALTVLTTPPPPIPTVRFTIPEGYTLEQIASAAETDLGLAPKAFTRAVGAAVRPSYVPEDAPGLEGFLFPDTYQIPEAARAQYVARKMIEQFEAQAEALGLEAGAEELGLTPYEVVIVASMIEEEAKVQRDRARIAAVIYNRLDQGMALGIDATLLYDDPTPDGQLSESDLAYDSPYNTRLNAGLPPTPISSPGEASLLAALHPADVPFLYYVLCGADGHHVFSVDYSDFLANVDRCLA